MVPLGLNILNSLLAALFTRPIEHGMFTDKIYGHI